MRFIYIQNVGYKKIFCNVCGGQFLSWCQNLLRDQRLQPYFEVNGHLRDRIQRGYQRLQTSLEGCGSISDRINKVVDFCRN